MDFLRKALLGKELYQICQNSFLEEAQIEKRLSILKEKGLHLSKDEFLELCNLNQDLTLKIDDEKLNDLYYADNAENLFCKVRRLNCSDEKDFEEIKRLVKLETDQLDFLGEYPSLALLCDYDDYDTEINKNIYYVATRGEIICGVMMVVPRDHFLKIAYLTSRAHSNPEYKGVGKMLIQKLISDFKNDKDYLGIYLESSKGAREFYTKMGFKPDSHLYYYYYLFSSYDEVLSKKIKMDISKDIDLLIENFDDIHLRELIQKGFLTETQIDNIRGYSGLYNDLFDLIPISKIHIEDLINRYHKSKYPLLVNYIKNGVKLNNEQIGKILDHYISTKTSTGVDPKFTDVLTSLEATDFRFDKNNVIRLGHLIGSRKFEEYLRRFGGSKGDLEEIYKMIKSEKNREVIQKILSEKKGCVIQ